MQRGKVNRPAVQATEEHSAAIKAGQAAKGTPQLLDRLPSPNSARLAAEAVLTAEKSGKCTICCKELTSNKLKLRCGHTFHARCLKEGPHEACSAVVAVACPLCCQKPVHTLHQSVLPPLSTPTQVTNAPG